MRTIGTWAGFVVAVALVAGTAQGLTVEEAIAKHVEARGGKAAWDRIQSIKMTGEFTAFSKIKPFTLHRQRDDKYHMDHMLGEKKVVVGYDGETAWWDNHWFQEGAQAMTGPDLEVLYREADFVTPLFEVSERGWEVEMLGETEVEGIPAIGIKLIRGEGSEETWYLDPDSFLEIARDSPGSDFGRPMPQRTFFEDFRDVGGVKIPHYVESQWYTRDRVMRVENVELNPEIDAEMFVMPAPMGMGPVLAMAGAWQVAAEQRPQPGAPWQESEYESTIAAKLGGALLEEQYETEQGTSIRTLSYDRFRKAYRVTEINDATTYMDILEGDINEDGRLVVSNMETGTTLQMFGMTIHGRMSYFDITPDGFKMEYEASIDGGENWFVAAKATYSRGAE